MDKEQLKLEIKLKELENKIENSSKKKTGWIGVVVSIIGWAILIGVIVMIWLNLQPILNKINSLLNITSGTVQNINKGASASNEILNKVNHPIDSTMNGLGF